MRKQRWGLALGVALTALLAGQGALEVRAETPKDGLVMADFIDDMISLDPAEVFEFSAAEIQAQIYDRLVTYPPDEVSQLEGLVAESWSVSDDGRTVTFKIRPGITFHSGNPLTARDVEFSLRRVVKLNLSPGFILTQFGFTPENMGETIKATDDSTLVLTLDQPYAPTFLLYCLTAGVGSVVDMKLAMENEKDGDMGHAWLKTNSAGSGPFKLRAWKPNESVMLDANPDYWRGAPQFKRVITRHIPEAATQRLLLEKGDIDVARKLSPEDVQAVSANDEIEVVQAPKGAIWYMGLNQKNPNLAKPEVREALKWLVDYDALVGLLADDRSVRDAVIAAVTASKGYRKLVSHVLYQGVKGYLLTENVVARKLPGASTLVKFGQKTMSAAAPNLEAGVDRRLTAFVEANLSETLRESRRYLEATLTPELLTEMADEVWTTLADRPVDRKSTRLNSSHT